MPRKSDQLDELIAKRKVERKKQISDTVKRRSKNAVNKARTATTQIKKAKELIEGNMLRNGAVYFELMMEVEYHYKYFRHVTKHRLLMTLLYLVWAHDQVFLHYTLFFAAADIKYKEDRKIIRGLHRFLMSQKLADRAPTKRDNKFIYFLTPSGKEVATWLHDKLKEKYSVRVPNILDQYRFKTKRESINMYRVAKAVRAQTRERNRKPPIQP